MNEIEIPDLLCIALYGETMLAIFWSRIVSEDKRTNRRPRPRITRFNISFNSFEELEFLLKIVGEPEHGRNIAATSAIVGSRPHGDELLIKHISITLLNELMSPTDEFQVVQFQKSSCDF